MYKYEFKISKFSYVLQIKNSSVRPAGQMRGSIHLDLSRSVADSWVAINNAIPTDLPYGHTDSD